MSDYQILNRFIADNIQKATVGLLHYLGIATDLITEEQVAITDLVEQPTKAVQEICRKIRESYLVCSISDRTFSDEEQDETLDEVKENIGKYDQMLVFAVDLHEDTKLCRTEMATLNRALNRASKAAPVVVVFRYYDNGEVRFALSLCERTAYLQAGHTGEKVGRVNILRGINPQKTHAGHIRILEDMRLEKKDKSFEGVYQKWLGVFDNDVLTNQFYKELQNWYFWALKPECRVSFPNDVASDIDDDKYNPQNIIRLITRLIFVWFLRQKGLVPKDLFKRDSLARLLKNFKPEDLNSSTYYRAVLQNLFFATLNKKIEEREFMSDEFIMNRNKGKHDVKTFMRHASDLQVSKEEFIELLHPVPFMNNSLFECLDNKEQNGHVYNWDGFSDSKKPQKQAFVPNYLFFAEDVYIDLSEEYGKPAASSVKVSGIINILSKYTFTVEENTPLDVDVALDPELLGKVFENLLAAYNPETKETVRKSTGSYYTPRPIVQYMVDESLIAYLKKQVDGVSEDTLRSLLSYSDDDAVNPLDREQTRRLVDAIFRCKVLDPACGSGAFPMGILQQMAHLLSRVDSDNRIWEEVVIDNAIRYENTIDTMSDEEKAERQAEREKVFALSVDYPDYARKLYLIENCIYGVDLQSIAVQISRLRFFISLVCEQQPTDDASDNYGIHPLPNLEMKFVCANTLVKLENISETRELFANDEIIKLIQELKGVRHELFVVTNSHVKKRLLSKDKTIRDQIMLSTGDCYTRDTEEKIARHKAGLAECAKEMRIAERMSDEVITQAVTQDLFGDKEEVISYSPKQNKIKAINQRISYIKREIKRLQDSLNSGRDKAMRLAKQLTDWNPYDQNLSSPFFDADWMFGVTDGFDVVIGNPPYISAPTQVADPTLLKQREYLANCNDYETLYQKWDLYIPFMEYGVKSLNNGGCFSMIVPYPVTNQLYAKVFRHWLMTNYDIIEIVDLNGTKVFENATVSNVVLFARGISSTHQTYISHIDDKGTIHRSFLQPHDKMLQDEKTQVWNLTQEQRIGKRHPEMLTLGDYCYVSKGMVLNADEKTAKGAFKKDELISETKDDVHCRPYVEAKDIERYAIKRVRYLEYNTDRVPDKLSRPTFRELYDRPKLICNRLGGLKLMIDAETYYLQSDSSFICMKWADLASVNNKSITSSVKKFCTKPRKEMEVLSQDMDLRFLLGVLNSTYASVLLNDLRGGDYHIYPEHIRSIAIPPAASSEQATIIDLVDRILAVKQADPQADTSADERVIDMLVYKLYGLTYDEVKIVDPETDITEEEYDA